jgi:uncharacterized protein (DUF1697 family)
VAVWAALLRAVNVGGTGKLAMSRLREICEELGFADPVTYIQSGNVVFRTGGGEAAVQRGLERALAGELGKPVGVHLRTAGELAAVLERNPFRDAPPSKVLVLFLDAAPAKGSLDDLVIPGREEVRLAGREVFVHFPDGMGRSKLKLPFAKTATGRNLNTVAKLLELARRAAGEG